jgi:hypothetical protein
MNGCSLHTCAKNMAKSPRLHTASKMWVNVTKVCEKTGRENFLIGFRTPRTFPYINNVYSAIVRFLLYFSVCELVF